MRGVNLAKFYLCDKFDIYITAVYLYQYHVNLVTRRIYSRRCFVCGRVLRIVPDAIHALQRNGFTSQCCGPFAHGLAAHYLRTRATKLHRLRSRRILQCIDAISIEGGALGK